MISEAIGVAVRFAVWAISCYISFLRLLLTSPQELLLYPVRKTFEIYRFWTDLAWCGVKAAVLLLGLGLFSLVLFFVSPSFSLYLKMIFLMLNFVVLMGVQLFGMDFLLQGLHSLNPLHMATTFSAVCFGSWGLLYGFLFGGTMQQRMVVIAVFIHCLLFYFAFIHGSTIMDAPTVDPSTSPEVEKLTIPAEEIKEEIESPYNEPPLFTWDGTKFIPHQKLKQEL